MIHQILKMHQGFYAYFIAIGPSFILRATSEKQFKKLKKIFQLVHLLNQFEYKKISFSKKTWLNGLFSLIVLEKVSSNNLLEFIKQSFNAYPWPFCLTSSEGILLFINHAFSKWIGLSAVQTIHKNLKDIVKQEENTHFFSFLGAQKKIFYGSLFHTMPFENGDYLGLFFLPSDLSHLMSNDVGILSFLPVPAAILNEQGNIKQGNQLLEKELKASIRFNLSLASWIHQEDKQILVKNLKRAKKNTQPLSDFSIRLQDQGEGNFRLLLQALRTPFPESPLEFLALFLKEKPLLPSVDEQVKDKDSESDRMQILGQLASGIVHDFNNLLTGIMGFCDLLLQRHKPEEASFKDIEQIKKNSMRAAKLIQQLLAFSRSTPAKKEPLKLKESLEELTPLIRRMIGPKIWFTLQEKGHSKVIEIDKGQLEQVLLILAINARDSMPEGGHLTFRLKSIQAKQKLQTAKGFLSPGSYVVIDVADTGSGIAPENLSRIFEPFFSTKDPGNGTGLGLSNVLQIIEQFQGGIQVSTELGKGTTFSLYFPECKTLPEKVSISVVENDEDKSVSKAAIKILFVEDEDPIRLFASRALREKGHEVIEARDGTQALRLMGKNPEIQLIITDVMMPGIDGPSLASSVKEMYPDMKILFVSGYPEDEVRMHLPQNLTGIYFLQKPFALSDLISRIQKLFEEDQTASFSSKTKDLSRVPL